MKSNEYKLKTVAEIQEVVTSSNIEGFVKDFHAWLALSVKIKEEKNKGFDIKHSTPGMFHWIDDGKNDITLRVEVRKPE